MREQPPTGCFIPALLAAFVIVGIYTSILNSSNKTGSGNPCVSQVAGQ